MRDSRSGALLTVAEVAAALRVCRATVYKICGEGRLPHVRVSNAIRVPEEAVRAYLAAQLTSALVGGAGEQSHEPNKES